MKLQQMPQGQNFVVIPVSIIKGFGWKKEDIIEFKIVGEGKLLLFKK